MLTTGENHSFAMKSDGTVWAWGWNNGGQLDNGMAPLKEVLSLCRSSSENGQGFLFGSAVMRFAFDQ
ncbi:MAG: hypothetical protein LBQ00_06655 [Syntrophobacterales bacterium]|nr:hypothetical protein [Syntrophobacterales bacterium]